MVRGLPFLPRLTLLGRPQPHLQPLEDVLHCFVPHEQLLVVALDLGGLPAGDVLVDQGENLMLSP